MKRLVTREKRIDYIHRLRREGIYSLGKGFNAHAFAHPEMEDVAVKIVDATDRVYLHFADWSMKNQHNLFVPQIDSIVMVDVIGHSSYAIVFMERLQKLGTANYNLFLQELGFADLGCNRLSELDLMAARDSVRNDELRTVLDFLLTKPFSLDLHQANFMRRGEQVVFSDPFAGW